MSEPRTAWVYILECADGTLYTGWTYDLEARLAAHNAGTASKYTRTRRPVRMVYWERAGGKGDALRREWALKQLTRAQKLSIIHEFPD